MLLKSSKQVTQLKKELYKLDDKPKKTTNKNEVLQEELSEAKRELQLSQWCKHQLGSTQHLKNICNQVKGLHQEKIVGERDECTITNLGNSIFRNQRWKA